MRPAMYARVGIRPCRPWTNPTLCWLSGRNSGCKATRQTFLAGSPGALADHLTSFGGQLNNTTGQMTALEWLEAGVTASYGTVSEPCNHWQKFPHPQVLLLNYLQGATALEAYWRSVAWPAQGVLVGEPLAAPFGR
ncbi:MAG: TIGR03790 family protein [Betaproteobacteria bacterium]|nr:TIGR03790 family protein [Betaproteobacteria bacterium]